MARAYDHLTPFQRIRHFAYVRLYELNEQLEALNTELRMWNEDTVQNFLYGLRLDANAFFKRKPDAVREAIAEISKEIQYWEALNTEINLISCPACQGAGQFRTIVDQDESYTTKCERCKGTGKLSPTIADIPA